MGEGSLTQEDIDVLLNPEKFSISEKNFLKKERPEPEYMDSIDLILMDIKLRYQHALKKHPDGWKTKSPHEVLGLLTEEYHEFIDEIRKNNLYTQTNELLDIAVVCILGIFSADYYKNKTFGEVKRNEEK